MCNPRAGPGDSCPYPTTSDQNYQDASGASTQATADKTSFTNLWDPLAASLGLAQYDQSQISRRFAPA